MNIKKYIEECGGECTATNTELAKHFKCSRSTVQRRVRALRAAGEISCEIKLTSDGQVIRTMKNERE